MTAVSTHWESSKRPLYVRTVLVNGSRHAILSYEDPLVGSALKNSRPSSAQSSRSDSSEESRMTKFGERHRGKNKVPRDLQACIVKLRLVLATQQKKRTGFYGQENRITGARNKRKRKGSRNTEKKLKERRENEEKDPCEKGENMNETKQGALKYDNNHNIAVASYFANAESGKCNLSHYNNTDNTCIKGKMADSVFNPGSTISSLNMQPDHDIPWNTISAESYFTRPFFNRLSERVLQWLDMSTKDKREKLPEQQVECKTEPYVRHKIVTSRNSNRSRSSNVPRDDSEDNAEEVKQEEDVDTAMSCKMTSYSQDLSRQHQLKAEIPEKESSNTMELQETIARSFTNVVSIRSGKYAQKPLKIQASLSDRRSQLIRQNHVEEDSDEDKPAPVTPVEKVPSVKQPRIYSSERTIESKVTLSKQTFMIPQQISPHLQTRIPWLKEYKSGPFWPVEKSVIKPQLHIFIPSLDEEEVMSDADSVRSDLGTST